VAKFRGEKPMMAATGPNQAWPVALQMSAYDPSVTMDRIELLPCNFPFRGRQIPAVLSV